MSTWWQPKARRKRWPTCAISMRQQLAALDVQVNALAAQGMRVLGVARASYRGSDMAGHPA